MGLFFICSDNQYSYSVPSTSLVSLGFYPSSALYCFVLPLILVPVLVRTTSLTPLRLN